METIEEIQKLKTLLDQGAITHLEFKSLKSNLISNLNNHRSSGDNERNKTDLTKNEKAEITQTPTPQKPVFQQNQPINKNDSTSKYLFILATVVVLFIAIGVSLNNSSSGSSSNSSGSCTYEDNSTITTKNPCNICKGTGIQVCNLCGGSAKNNLGMTCTCITEYENDLALGNKPYHEPLQWTCVACKGTGESNH